MAKNGVERIPALDGIRGIAILMVMSFHFSDLMQPSSYIEFGLKRALSIGWAGVDLFFVLSGFLITGNLLKSKNEQFGLRNFYARRILRIVPAYYFALALPFIILPLIQPGISEGIVSHQAWLWLYCGNYAQALNLPQDNNNFLMQHFWSLAVEEHYYVFWPIFVWHLNRRKLAGVCVALILASILFRAFIPPHLNPIAGVRMTHCRLDELAMGSLLAIYNEENDALSKLRTTAFFGFCISGIAAVVLIFWRNMYGDQEYVFKFSILGVFFSSGLVIALTTKAQAILVVLSSRLLCFFGKYSYGLYIYHLLFMPLLVREFVLKWQSEMDLISWLVLLIFLLSASIGMALLSWFLIERYFLKLKKRFE